MSPVADTVSSAPSYRSALIAALVTIASLVLVGIGWGMFAKLDSAVVTQGVLFAESERKSIENLEGGILESLRVQPGDRVTKGQILAVLDATQIRESRTQLEVDRLSPELRDLAASGRGCGTAEA